MKQHYDIAIIGGGIGGLMTAFRITETDPSASVCIFRYDWRNAAIFRQACSAIQPCRNRDVFSRQHVNNGTPDIAGAVYNKRRLW